MSLTFTTKEDTCGVLNTTAKDTVKIDSSTKYFVYDYNENDTNRVAVVSTLDGNRGYDQLIKLNVDAETAEKTAPRILVYYTGNYSAKAIIILKY